MLRLRSIVSSLALITLLSASLVAATTPTCLLTGLTLYDSSNGHVIPIHDAFNQPFNPNCGSASNCFTYWAECTADMTKVQLSVNANDQQTTYDMRFKSGKGTLDQQYMALNVASKQLTLEVGMNEIDINPSCTACSAHYVLWCNKPTPAGQVVGDPQFTGLRGQSYQVHGVSGEVYSIISDAHLQMNSKFVFLNKGSCPVIDGVKAQGCWSHAGSYLGEIGIKTAGGDRLKIVSGRANQGYARVELNGEVMKVGQSADLLNDGQPGFVSFNNSYLVTVAAGNYLLEFDNSDLFINQRVRVVDWTTLKSHGLLGQTWRNKVYNNPIKHIEGAVDDYVVRGKDLFGDNFIFNQFGAVNALPSNTGVDTPVAKPTPIIAKKPTKKPAPVVVETSDEDTTIVNEPIAIFEAVPTPAPTQIPVVARNKKLPTKKRGPRSGRPVINESN